MFTTRHRQLLVSFFSLLLLSLLSFSSTTYAQMYQWRDDDGNVHFSDKKPINVTAKKKAIKVENKGISFANEKAVSQYKSRTKAERKHELAQRNIQKQQLAHAKKASRQKSHKKKMTYNDRSSKKQYSAKETAAGLEAARLLRQRRQFNLH